MNIYFTYLPYILLISNNFILSLSFNLPPVFREWHCINFVKNIDVTKPHPFKIGDLPLISWHDNIYNKTYTTVNICSHMGSKLDKSKIKLYTHSRPYKSLYKLDDMLYNLNLPNILDLSINFVYFFIVFIILYIIVTYMKDKKIYDEIKKLFHSDLDSKLG